MPHFPIEHDCSFCIIGMAQTEVPIELVNAKFIDQPLERLMRLSLGKDKKRPNKRANAGAACASKNSALRSEYKITSSVD